jgi:hypothetical protein
MMFGCAFTCAECFAAHQKTNDSDRGTDMSTSAPVRHALGKPV